MNKVLVLLSTYNGERYIKEQIESILNQTYKEIDILIRDDGSTDKTIQILEYYKQNNLCIDYYIGNNLGSCNSFFDLIKHAGEYEYYSFADQDDVWLPNKIEVAIRFLEKKTENDPIMYCSNVILVDEQLKEVSSVLRRGKIVPSFGNALVEGICTGCTCVMNKKLFYIIKSRLPKEVFMHDWWFYLVASLTGTVYYDKNCYMMYRQHNNNVIGVPQNYFRLYIRRIKNLHKTKNIVSKQAMSLKDFYELDLKKQKLVQIVINSRSSIYARIKIILSKEIYRQNKLDNMLYKLLILIRGC